MPSHIRLKKMTNPALAAFLAYLIAIFLGGVVLWLPISTHRGISFTDAIFTSSSALSVTGLAVQDTPTCFTTFGQCAILFLIQLGGLGILTFSAFIIRLLSGRLGLEAKSWLEESIVQDYARDLYHFVKAVFAMVFTIEIIGAFCLFWSFYPEHSWKESIYLAVFHSISAFCNAGFALFSNSMESYRGALGLNLVISILVVLGGLGFMVLEDIYAYLTKRHHALSFHTKIVLVTSTILTCAGFTIILLLESSGSFQNMPIQDQLLASWFQSVISRTAGFNSIPVGQLSSATLFLLIVLMFIGASPASMAGGIKTTTFTLIIAQLVARLRGRPCPEIFHRTVSPKYMERVIILFILAVLIVVFFIFVLLIIESDNTYLQHSRSPFLTVVFEVVSAFATTGLSMGLTPELSVAGKWLLSFLMLVGRIGPLSLAIFLMSIPSELDYQYPEEEVMIG